MWLHVNVIAVKELQHAYIKNGYNWSNVLSPRWWAYKREGLKPGFYGNKTNQAELETKTCTLVLVTPGAKSHECRLSRALISYPLQTY